MSGKFEKRCEKIDIKKAKITKEYMNEFCLERSNLRKPVIKRKLKKYADKLTKLEMKKYNINKHVSIVETKNPGIYGSMRYANGLNLYRDKDNGKVKIGIGSTMCINYNTVISKLKSDDIEIRKEGFVKYMETIHHEVGHLEQHVATENSSKIKDIPDEYALKYALEFVSISELKATYYKKGDNYRKMLIEKNAREKGAINTLNVLDRMHKKRLFRDNYFQRIGNLVNDEFIELENLESENGIEERSTMTTSIVDEAIKNNPKYLRTMPILQKVYTLDGRRKPIYQTVRENAISTRKIKNNPFISKKEKNRMLKESQDIYSEIFTESLKQYIAPSNSNSFIIDDKSEELKLAGKVLGKKSLNKMIEIATEHYERKYNDFVQSAEDEKEVRKKFDGNIAEGNWVYRERIESSNNRYAPYVQMLHEFGDYVSSMNIRKMSSSDVNKQLKIDELNVKNNIKKNKIKQNSKNVRVDEVKDEVSNSDLSLDIKLEEMRSLKEEYIDNKNYNMAKLEHIENEYYDLDNKSKEKDKDIYQR